MLKLSENSIFRNTIVPVVLMLMLFCHYYYLYFVDFNEGMSYTPISIYFLKILASIMFYFCFFELINDKIKINIFSVSIGVAIVILCFKSQLLPINDFIFLNFFVLALPYVFLNLKLRAELIYLFFPVLIVVLCFQVVVDCFLVNSNVYIWENKAFIGGLGNPSTFGIVCNIAIAYILAKEDKRYYFIPLLILVYGVFQTKSLATSGVLLAIHVIHFFSQKNRKDFLSSMLLGLITIFILLHNMDGHLAYKVDSLINYMRHILGDQFFAEPTVSISVSYRVAMYRHLFDGFFESPLKTSLLGLSDVFYNAADSQFVTFSGSFGLLLSFIILYKMIFPFFGGELYNSYFCRKQLELFLWSIV